MHARQQVPKAWAQRAAQAPYKEQNMRKYCKRIQAVLVLVGWLGGRRDIVLGAEPHVRQIQDSR